MYLVLDHRHLQSFVTFLTFEFLCRFQLIAYNDSFCLGSYFLVCGRVGHSPEAVDAAVGIRCGGGRPQTRDCGRWLVSPEVSEVGVVGILLGSKCGGGRPAPGCAVTGSGFLLWVGASLAAVVGDFEHATNCCC